MPEPGSPGGGRHSGRVEVYYFPKRTRAPRQSLHDAPAHDGRTVEFQPDFGDHDAPPKRPDPNDTPTEEIPAVSVPGSKRSARRTRSSDRVRPGTRTTLRDRPRRIAPSRRRLSVEIDTDPALRYHVQKLDELLAAKSPADSLRTLSRRQLAEMALFGHQLFETGRLEEARVVFEGLVGLGTPDAFPHTMLGTVYLAQGKLDRAMALFEEALEFDPHDLAARVYRSELRINQGHTRQAMAELAQVIAEGPADDPFVERAHRLVHILRAGAKRRR
ncbi:MAG: tetratricopeptide repeat protein [Myxococcaceae bacterium]|nr:tetratricopeptide repeat protein [Myxococcaceae bacterium]